MKYLRSFTSVLLLVTAAIGCSDEEAAPPTQLLISVSADRAVAAALERLDVSLYDADSDGEPLRVEQFTLTRAKPQPGEVRLPFSFGIVKRRSDRVKLVIEGFASADAGATPVIEHKRLARFAPGKTRQVEINLSEACFEREEACSGSGQTCEPDAESGSACVLVATRELADAGAKAEPSEDETDASARDAAPVDAALDAAESPGDSAVSDAAATPRDAAPTMESAPDGGTHVASGEPVGACAGNNACTSAAYPCVDNGGASYTCRGQFADWPMPDTSPGAKATASYDYASKPGVVLDRVTTLSWQRTPPKVYPGCSGRDRAQGDTCTWTEAAQYCAALDLDGQGWRLPTKIELESLIGNTSTPPAIDFTAFPETSGAQWFWSASPLAVEGDDSAWRLQAGFGVSNPFEIDEVAAVRCVRGNPPVMGTPADRYRVDAATDTVTDTRTQLIWQRRYGDHDTWDEAKAYCAGLPGGFRLPGLKELQTLIDPTRSEPAVVPAFPAIPLGGVFWTSAQFYGDVTDGMVVDFSAGISSAASLFRMFEDTVRITFHTRCVR